MMNQGNEVMIQWMRDSYNIADEVDIDENYPGYSGMVAVYEDEMQREEYESSMQWYEDHPYHEIYNMFCGRMRQLNEIVENEKNPFTDKMMLQMAYAHSVTLFEAMVGDVIKAALTKYPHMMERLVKGISDSSEEKYTLKKIVELGGIDGIAMSVFNDLTFHNISVVKRYVNMLCNNKMNNRHIGNMFRVAQVRHDLVHRNGRSKDGDYHTFDTDYVNKTLEQISLFSVDVYQAVISGVEDDKKVDF